MEVVAKARKESELDAHRGLDTFELKIKHGRCLAWDVRICSSGILKED